MQSSLVPALVPLGSAWFQTLTLAGFTCKSAWFRPWFHLVPHRSQTWCLQDLHANRLGSTLGSTRLRNLTSGVNFFLGTTIVGVCVERNAKVGSCQSGLSGSTQPIHSANASSQSTQSIWVVEPIGKLNSKMDEFEMNVWQNDFETVESEIDVCPIEFEMDKFEMGVCEIEFKKYGFERVVGQKQKTKTTMV